MVMMNSVVGLRSLNLGSFSPLGYTIAAATEKLSV